MVTRTPKPPKTSLIERLVWLATFLVSLHALILKHDGQMSEAGSVHLATDRADEGVMAFYERFPK
jgi:hypothetical protein